MRTVNMVFIGKEKAQCHYFDLIVKVLVEILEITQDCRMTIRDGREREGDQNKIGYL